MIKLKEILLEIETDVDKAFGKFAFDLGGFEGNTKTEDKLYTLIGDWLYDASTDSELYKYKNLLQRAKQKFPKIFKPEAPNGTTLYRGVSGTEGPLLDILKKKKIVDLKYNFNRDLFSQHFEEIASPSTPTYVPWYRYKTPIKYKPHKFLQSWTDDGDIAIGFNAKFLLETKQDDDFIFNRVWLRNTNMGIYQPGLDDGDGYDERETIHFGKSYRSDVYLIVSSRFLDGYISYFDNKRKEMK
jgi:hypothetical protein